MTTHTTIQEDFDALLKRLHDEQEPAPEHRRGCLTKDHVAELVRAAQFEHKALHKPA